MLPVTLRPWPHEQQAPSDQIEIDGLTGVTAAEPEPTGRAQADAGDPGMGTRIVVIVAVPAHAVLAAGIPI